MWLGACCGRLLQLRLLETCPNCRRMKTSRLPCPVVMDVSLIVCRCSDDALQDYVLCVLSLCLKSSCVSNCRVSLVSIGVVITIGHGKFSYADFFIHNVELFRCRPTRPLCLKLLILCIFLLITYRKTIYILKTVCSETVVFSFYW